MTKDTKKIWPFITVAVGSIIIIAFGLFIKEQMYSQPQPDKEWKTFVTGTGFDARVTFTNDDEIGSESDNLASLKDFLGIVSFTEYDQQTGKEKTYLTDEPDKVKWVRMCIPKLERLCVYGTGERERTSKFADCNGEITKKVLACQALENKLFQ